MQIRSTELKVPMQVRSNITNLKRVMQVSRILFKVLVGNSWTRIELRQFMYNRPLIIDDEIPKLQPPFALFLFGDL